MKGKWSFLCAALLVLTLSACAVRGTSAADAPPKSEPVAQAYEEAAPDSVQSAQEAPPARRLEVDYNARAHSAQSDADGSSDEMPDTEGADIEASAEESGAAADSAPVLKAGTPDGRLIVIDPGHQAQGNDALEPLGPGSSETKIKVSSGTASCNTGEPESRLVLAISLKLQEELESRGYTVLMTRTTEDVDLSNSERAAIANNADADAFVRVHANGSESADMSGAMTICQSACNAFNADLYAESYDLSAAILDELTAQTGCRRLYVWETDTMSGINWSRVPVTIVEVGFMTNPEEDRLLATEDYQQKVAVGIADGIDRYFREQSENSGSL